MRVGLNPLKGESLETPPIVFAVVTHLPNTDGYHAKRFEVVKACIKSMTAHNDYPLIVWDNGSCDRLRLWLQNYMSKETDTLIQSPNVGKINARNAIFRMFPPETIVCYSDDDMLFESNWLSPQLELLNHFPNTACVSGYATRPAFRWGNTNTLNWANKNATVEVGEFISQDEIHDYYQSLGKEAEYGGNDIRITYNGKQAYATAHHCQFIARAGTVDKALVWSTKYLESESGFDVAMDKQGLRLATINRLVKHIGNVMDD